MEDKVVPVWYGSAMYIYAEMLKLRHNAFVDGQWKTYDLHDPTYLAAIANEAINAAVVLENEIQRREKNSLANLSTPGEQV